jgi:hypothetical protein
MRSINLDRHSRFTLGAAALAFGFLAGWMYWIVQTRLVGQTWIDFVVRLILDEFILTVAVFCVVLLLGAVFAPKWLSRAIAAVRSKLMIAIGFFGLLFAAGLLFVIVFSWIEMLKR